MAEQIFTFAASAFFDRPSAVDWRYPSGSRAAINADLRGQDARFLAWVQLLTSGEFRLYITSNQTEAETGTSDDLSDAFETSGSVEIIVPGHGSLLVSLAGADTTEPYTWLPSNSNEVVALYNSLNGLGDDAVGATVILRDFVPAAPSFADDTGTPITATVGDAIADVVVPEAVGPERTGNEQTIALDASAYIAFAGSIAGWQINAPNRPQLDAGFSDGTRFLAQVSVGQGNVRLFFVDGQSDAETDRADLSDTFEMSGSAVISSGGQSVQVNLNNADVQEPYDWTPSNSADVASFRDSLPDAGMQSGSLILRDFVPGRNPLAPAPTYAVVGNLPAGVSFDPDTRILSFDEAQIVAGSGTIVIRAMNSEGSDDWMVDYAFSAALAAPVFADDTGTPISGHTGNPIVAITVPEASGNPAPTYAVVGFLPSGLQFDPATRVLSGTPDTAGTGTIVVRATNSQGSDDWMLAYHFTDEFVPPQFEDEFGGAILVAVGDTIAEITIPRAAGSPDPTYELIGEAPSGLTVTLPTTASDGSITGTPDAVASGSITVRATNSQGFADWRVTYEFVALGMKVNVQAAATEVVVGESVRLTAEAYGDLIAIEQAGGESEVLWALTQVADGSWRLLQRGSISGANLRNPRGLATKGGALYAVDWWGEDIWSITDIDTGAATEVGAETTGSFGAPEGAVFIGDVLWAIDQQGDDLWSWDDVDTAPNSGVQRGSVSIAGSPRGMTVRNGLLIIVTEDGSNWAVLQVDNTTTGASTSLASTTGLPTGVTGPPRAIQEYRGSLWILTEDAELVEVTGIGDTPAFVERADFDPADLRTDGLGGMTQFPMPVSAAWLSGGEGVFSDTGLDGATWDSTGVTPGTTVTLTLRVTDGAGNTFDRSVDVTVRATTGLEVGATFAGGLVGTLNPAVELAPLPPLDVDAALQGGLVGTLLPAVIRPPLFVDDVGDTIMAHVGDAVADVVVPEAESDPGATYAVVGSLPAGVSFDPSSRILSFDENSIAIGLGTIVVRATNIGGSDDWSIGYVFSAAAVAPSFADDTGDPISGTLGSPISDVVVPSATGNPAPTYAAVGNLPAGVTFDANTRTLSFDDGTIQVGSGTITIRATNSAGSDDWSATYAFVAATPGAIAPQFTDDTGDAIMGRVGEPIADVVVPEAVRLPGNEQTLSLPGSWYTPLILVSRKQWAPPANSRPAIDAALRADPDESAFFSTFEIWANGVCLLHIAGAQTGAGDRVDLNDGFEQAGDIRIEAAGASLSLDLTGQDTAEPYGFAASTEGNTFYNALPTSGEQAGTLRIRDYDPAAAPTPAPAYSVVGNLPAGVSFNASTRTLSFDENQIVAGSGTIVIRVANSAGSDDWMVAYDFQPPATVEVGATFQGNLAGTLAPGVALEQVPDLSVDATFQGGLAGTLSPEVAFIEPRIIDATFAGNLNGLLSPGVDLAGAPDFPLDVAFIGGLDGTLDASVGLGRTDNLVVDVAFRGELDGTLDALVSRSTTLARSWVAVERSLVGDLAKYAMEVTHPDLATPVRLVADTVDHIIEGNDYTHANFKPTPPQFATGEIPKARIELGNVGRPLMRLFEATRGGHGAQIRLMLVLYRETGSQIVWEVPALAVGSAAVTNQRVDISLSGRHGRRRPGIKLRHSTSVSPGVF